MHLIKIVQQKFYLLILIFGFLNAGFANGNFGFEPVASPAVDFELERYDSGTLKLSSQKGQWILLFFWATWCGPCLQELPSINEFAKKHHGRELKVVSVNVDGGEVSDVRQKINEIGIAQFHFPMALDLDNKIAQRYQASSIPVAYLINPKWSVVAMIRGARDWEGPAFFTAMKEFMAENKAKVSDGASGALAPSTVSLGPKLVPPSLSMTTPSIGDQPGVWNITLEVSWSGNLSDYVFKAPILSDNSHGKILTSQVESTEENGIPKIRYFLSVSPNDKALVQLGSLDLGYSARGYQNWQYVKSGQISLGENKIAEKKSDTTRNLILIFGSVTLIGLLSFYGWSKHKKRSKILSQTKALGDREKIANLWVGSESLKINGSQQSYQKKVLEVMIEIHRTMGDPIETFEKKLEAIVFGGQKLEATEIEILVRKIELYLNGKEN